MWGVWGGTIKSALSLGSSIYKINMQMCVYVEMSVFEQFTKLCIMCWLILDTHVRLISFETTKSQLFCPGLKFFLADIVRWNVWVYHLNVWSICADYIFVHFTEALKCTEVKISDFEIFVKQEKLI